MYQPNISSGQIFWYFSSNKGAKSIVLALACPLWRHAYRTLSTREFLACGVSSIMAENLNISTLRIDLKPLKYLEENLRIALDKVKGKTSI